MKITRSSKIHYNRFLTGKKKSEIRLVLDEYSKIVNYFIVKYQGDIPDKTKFDLLLANNIQSCISETGTWLSARMVKNAFSEGYGMVQSYKSNLESNDKHSIPNHTGKKMILSSTINTQHEIVNTKDFDFGVTLGSIGNKMKIYIPLKRHRHFNKWNDVAKRSSTITVTDSYIQFSFEQQTGKKKTGDNKIGVDIGVNKLITTNNGKFIGDGFKDLLRKLKNKKQKSKSYKRTKLEIKEYVNKSLKEIQWNNIDMIVVEKLKKVKHKMKVKRRMTKTNRFFISNWNYRYILDRIQRLSEENRVSFRSVSPYYTSIECSSCGHRDKRNRVNQEKFLCLNCGTEDNADINAAKNILNRFLTTSYS